MIYWTPLIQYMFFNRRRRKATTTEKMAPTGCAPNARLLPSIPSFLVPTVIGPLPLLPLLYVYVNHTTGDSLTLLEQDRSSSDSSRFVLSGFFVSFTNTHPAFHHISSSQHVDFSLVTHTSRICHLLRL